MNLIRRWGLRAAVVGIFDVVYRVFLRGRARELIGF